MADLIKQLTDALAAAHAGAVAEPPPLPKWANVEAATTPQVQDIAAAMLVTDSESETADMSVFRLELSREHRRFDTSGHRQGHLRLCGP